MTRPQAVAETPRDAAMGWLLRRDARPLSADEREAFQTWLETPENREAYAALETLWAATGEVEDHPRFEEKRRKILKSVDRARTSRRAMAAGLAAAVLGLGSLGVYSYNAPKPLADQSFQTAVGQRATVTLPDGSSVTLNTDTVVRTRADQDRRLVYLDKGQAFFRVARDRRHPFVVAAGGRTVTALGTAFDVRIDRGA
ncbi:MAG TPA: FecR domain-containing protein, partial [Caulobacteraceae bacterium]|nr:FecR domain-containing protein [Caulobacteraceae bacterium]